MLTRGNYYLSRNAALLILAFHCMWLQFFIIMLHLHCRSVPMALLYQWCWAGFLTVYTVNVNWAGHAGPQKCFSVNNTMHILCSFDSIYCTVMALCFYSVPFYDGGQDQKNGGLLLILAGTECYYTSCLEIINSASSLQTLLEWFCSEKAQFII